LWEKYKIYKKLDILNRANHHLPFNATKHLFKENNFKKINLKRHEKLSLIVKRSQSLATAIFLLFS